MSAPSKPAVRIVHADKLRLIKQAEAERWSWALIDDDGQRVASGNLFLSLEEMVAKLSAVFELDATVEWYVRRIERGTLKTMETVNGRSLLVEIRA